MIVKLSMKATQKTDPIVNASPRTILWLAAGAAVISLSLGTMTTAHADSSRLQASDETALTITLPTPNTPAAAAPAEIPAQTSLPAPNFQNPTVCAIGRVNQDGAQLVRRAGSDAMQVLYTCPAGQNIGIVGQMGEWYCVMMADNSLGCILVDRVNLVWQRADGDASDPIDRGKQNPASSADSWPHSTTARLNVPAVPHLNMSSIASPAAGRLIENAMKYLGTPYVWGGNTASGIDCSGLVKAVFSREGIELPRTAHEQAEVGTPVTLAEVQPGDRLSFACHSSSVDHTAIYIGNGEFIHASGGRGQVCITKLEGPYLRWLRAIHRDTHE